MSLAHRTGTFVGISCSKYSFLGRRKSDNLFLNVPFFLYRLHSCSITSVMRAAEKPRPKNQNVFQKSSPAEWGYSHYRLVCVSSSLTLAVLATSAGDFNLIENKNFRATSALLRDSGHLHFEWFWARFLWKWLSPWPPSTVCFVSLRIRCQFMFYVTSENTGPDQVETSSKKGKLWILILFEVLVGPWERSGGRRLSLGAPRLIPLETINWTIDLQS